MGRLAGKVWLLFSGSNLLVGLEDAVNEEDLALCLVSSIQICTNKSVTAHSVFANSKVASLSLRLNLCTSEHANEQYVAAVAVGSLCSVASTSRVSQVRGYKCRWFQETHLVGEEILSSNSLPLPSRLTLNRAVADLLWTSLKVF